VTRVARMLVSSLGGFALLVGCAHKEYPPPYPAHMMVPWLDNYPIIPTTPPPAELAWRPTMNATLASLKFVPAAQEWQLWKERTESKQVCRGTGPQRKCRTVTPASAVDIANKRSVVSANLANMNMGSDVQARFVFDPDSTPLYRVLTSPNEFTTMFIVPGERAAIPLPLPDEDWEVHAGKQGMTMEGTETTVRREFILIRPKWAPMTTRAMLPLASGHTLSFEFISRAQPGMLSVAWETPPKPPEPPPIPIDKQPPLFEKAQAYTAYKLELKGKSKYPPAWFPEGVADDGKNTIIKLPSLEGIRAPVVQGIQQTGKPALVQSRLFIREEYGALLYVQGLWPALLIRDAAGLQVQATRLPPDSTREDGQYVPLRQVRDVPRPRARTTW